MPFKQDLLGRYSFTGALATWMQAIEGWYREDVRGDTTSLQDYTTQIAAFYAVAAMTAWAKDPAQAGNLRELQTILMTVQRDPAMARPAAYDMLDLVSQTNPATMLNGLAGTARAYARKHLGL